MIKKLAFSLLLTFLFTSNLQAEIVTLEGINVEGIALGKEAAEYANKFKFDSEYLNTCISTDGRAINHAKRIVSCVLRVVKSKNNENEQNRLPDDFCTSPEELQTRKLNAMMCEGEAEQSVQLERWASKARHVIKRRSLICSNRKLFLEVINAYMDGDKTPLLRETGYGCRVTDETQPVRILSSSKDGKTRHIQYQVPYSYDLSDGWASSSSIMSIKAYRGSRY